MTSSHSFVAREKELAKLDAYLNRSLNGGGQVCFVVGDAGSGKTTLVSEFTRQAQEQHKDLLVAVGQSDAQTGTGDAYLPFRELLSQLTGDVDAKLAQEGITQENAARLKKFLALSGQAIVDLGPDLIGIFVPGVGLATRAAAFAAEKVGWLDKLEQLRKQPLDRDIPGSSSIDQNHIYQQYTNVLNKMAEKQPLLLVLDDLHWADKASVGLLFRIGRRIGGSRILLIGTYRPEEVALGRGSERHPMEKVQTEFKRYYGDIWIDLDQTDEVEDMHFVDAFLASEPNRLSPEFRQKLYDHTCGHPLFTIELLRAMQERGDLIQDEDGLWIEESALDWEQLPARVEGVIEERISRLENEFQEVLSVASVEGEDFTAEVVAQIQSIEARRLVHQLSAELSKRHRLVDSRGIQQLDSSGQRLSLYRFQHNLFQTYLYNNMDEAERVYLHRDVGDTLEEMYTNHVDEIAVRLAYHYVEAGETEKARTYLRIAGEQAAVRYANDEAVTYFNQALELTPEDNFTERYDLLFAREKIWSLKGDREAQAQDLVTLETLAEAINDDLRRAEVALRRSRYAGETSDYPTALAAAKAAILSSQAAGDVSKEAAGYALCGMALRRQGDYDAAQIQLEHALSLARDSRARRTEASSLNSLAIIHISAGDFSEASMYFEQALHIYQEIGDRQHEIIVLSNLAAVTRERGDYAQAEPLYEQALQISREIGELWGQSATLNNLGNHYEEQGDFTKAKDYHEQALRLQREISDLEGEAKSLSNLARIYAKLGYYSKSKQYYQQCLNLCREIGDMEGEAVGLSFLSLLCHQMGEDEAALEHSQRALDITLQLGDRNTQAYPLTYLGHALVGLNRMNEAVENYQQAMNLRLEFDQPHLATEPIAGLARVYLAQDDLIQAQNHVDEIMDFLRDNTLDGTEEPFLVYLTCYRVLHANDDPRAQDVLNTAYTKLQEQAERIDDDELRHSFLENVAANREIISVYTQRE
jgi:tetratricopeptide (TPR) repeat protein